MVLDIGGVSMKIELSASLNNISQDDLRNAIIVEDGDFVLIPKKLTTIPVHNNRETHFINIEDILFVESFGKEITIHSENGEYLSDFNLYEIQKLSPVFIRINKSTVVNKSKIKRIRPELNMKYGIYLKERWLDVNRTYYYLFEEEMGI
jgi:DNA-binding LytR/AlgR family response regulator